jgi:hypothetical protein
MKKNTVSRITSSSRNWLQVKQRLVNELVQAKKELHQLLSEKLSWQNTLKNHEKVMVSANNQISLSRKSPIFAVFQSFGESIPELENPTIFELRARQKLLQHWTGVSDIDQFSEETGWRLDEVHSGPKPLFSRREQLLIFLITLRKGFTFAQMALLCGLQHKRLKAIFKNVLQSLSVWSQRFVRLPTSKSGLLNAPTSSIVCITTPTCSLWTVQ